VARPAAAPLKSAHSLGVRELAQLLNDMRTAGVIQDYAIFGAVAQMRYTELATTVDVDVLVSLPHADRLDLLAPIYEFCATRGFRPEGEAVRVRADHLAVIALSVGRAKDVARIVALLESKSTSADELVALAARHGLADAWQRFRTRFPDA
jgi:hypothetical protein